MNVRTGILLRVMQGEEYGKVYCLDSLLHGNRILTVGRMDRSVRNSIPVQESGSAYVSRMHCTLEKDGTTGQWFIRDGQWDGNWWKPSLNGTYVNSNEVGESGMPVKPGDIISIGDVKLRVEGY